MSHHEEVSSVDFIGAESTWQRAGSRYPMANGTAKPVLKWLAGDQVGNQSFDLLLF
jgi:hypothetical protein